MMVSWIMPRYSALPSLDHTELKRLVSYDPETGEFTRLITTSPRAQVGDIAGRTRPDGYRKICVASKEYYSHRLAWFYVHGVWPEQDVDHIDGDPSNNRLANLRAVTHAQNTLNSRQRPIGVSGLRGVVLHHKTGLWNARVRIDGKQRSLGYFRDKNEARQAYLKAVKELHGEFAFENRSAQI